MTRFRRPSLLDERGLSLVEVMAALLVFALMTLGITPLLISSVRGSALSRSSTVGKNVALKAMERVRGLPFLVTNTTKKLDVLDLYFPNLSTGYIAGTGDTAFMFTTTCTPSSPASPSCPAGLPAGYSVTYQAQFVKANSTGSGYTPVAPPVGYTWDSVTNDKPPTQLLRMGVMASWTVGADTKTYKLTTLVGDRKIGSDRVTSNAKVDYVVQFLTTYKELSGTPSNLVAKVGIGESSGESRLLSKASVQASGHSARLTRQPSIAGGSAEELGAINGATSIYAAAPDSADPAAIATASSATLTHPNLASAQVAFGEASLTSLPLRAKVAGDLPVASGGFLVNNSGSSFDFWVNTDTNGNQLQLGSDPLSTVAPLRPVASVRRLSGISLTGSTSVETTPLGAGRQVQAIATGKFGQLALFPVNFIESGHPEGRSVILVNNFDGKADCNSTATPATASTQVSYAAILKYWKETNENDGVAAGTYQVVELASTKPSDPLAAFNPTSNNPMVWEDPGGTDSNGKASDIYLFPVHHDHGLLGLVKHDHPGYLATDGGWSSLANIPASVTGASGGRITKGSLGGAIRFNSVPLNPNVPESNVSVSVGSFSCAASDLR